MLLPNRLYNNIANFISSLRLLLTLLGIIFLFNNQFVALFFCCLIGGLTDIIDGPIARALQQESFFGELLDIFCDSVSLTVVFMIAIYLHELSILIGIFFILREFWVYTIRRYAATKNISISSSTIGKRSSTIMYIGVTLFLAELAAIIPNELVIFEYHISLMSLSIFTIIFGLILSYVAAFNYTRYLFLKIKVSNAHLSMNQII